MLSLFSDEVRRNPYPAYARVREATPLMHDAGSGLYLVFDYAGVNRVLVEHETFSSRHGPADWLIFQDPPRHKQLRALVSKAFTPRSVVNLEGRIGEICRELLESAIGCGEMDGGETGRGELDLAEDFAIPLPMRVIGEMLGIPSDRARFKRWNDVILKVSYLFGAGPNDPEAKVVMSDFYAATAEMNEYLGALLEQRRAEPRDDLLTRLLEAQIEGERLSQKDILGFFQLLLLAGSETTTNLINNAVLAFIEFPEQLELLRREPALLEKAIEEVLRYRSPLQWMFRLTRREVELHGQVIPEGRIVLAMIGAANHDPKVFAEPQKLEIRREPNPHLAFGRGDHFCMGAPLARLEAKIALGELIGRIGEIELASGEPWEPRKGLHVHGPSRLRIRFGGKHD